MADDGYKGRDLDDIYQAFLPHLGRWLVLVAAIALGLYLFFRILGAEMQDDMQHAWTPHRTTATYAH